MDRGEWRAEPCYDAQGNVVPLDDSMFDECSFGSRVAEQVGATIEADRREAKEEHVDSGGDSLKGTTLDDYREKLDAMDHDERVAATVACLNRRGSFRDILYGLLGFCDKEKSYEEIEPFVEGFVEFRRNRQEPRRYVFMLLRTGALEEIELKEDGTPLTEEDKQQAIADGLAPEDLDLLVFDWRVATTDVGREAYADFSPKVRLEKLMKSYPDREDAFIRIMKFCRSPKSMGQIDDEFKGASLMGIDKASNQKRQPSSYIEKLDAAGAVAWDGSAWSLTDTGEECLQSREDVQGK